MDSLVSHGYHTRLLVDADDLSVVDSSSTQLLLQRKGGAGGDWLLRRLQQQEVERKQGTYAVVVTSISLPIAIDIGPGNEEHESRRLITLLKDIRIRGGTRRPRNRPKQVCLR